MLAARNAYAAQLEARLLAQHKVLQAAARAAGAKLLSAQPRPQPAAVSRTGAGPARAAGAPLRDRSNQPRAGAEAMRSAARPAMPAARPQEQPCAVGAAAVLRRRGKGALNAASAAASDPARDAAPPAREVAACAPAAALPGDRLAGRGADARGGRNRAAVLGPRAVTEMAEDFLALLRAEGPPEAGPNKLGRGGPSTGRPVAAGISRHAGTVGGLAGAAALCSSAGRHERPAASACQPDEALAGQEGSHGQARSSGTSVASGEDALAEQNRQAAAAPTYVSRRSMQASAVRPDAGRHRSMRPADEPATAHPPPQPHGSPASDSSPALSELVYELGGAGLGAGLPEACSGPPSVALGSGGRPEPGARRSYCTEQGGSAVASPLWLGGNSQDEREGSWAAGLEDPQRMGDLSLDQIEARIAALGRTLAPSRGLVQSSTPCGALGRLASDPDRVHGPAETGLLARGATPSAHWRSSAGHSSGAAAAASLPRGSTGKPAGAQQVQPPMRQRRCSAARSGRGDEASLQPPSAGGAGDSPDAFSDLGSAVRAWARSPTPRAGSGAQDSAEELGGGSLDGLLQWAAACPSGALAAAPVPVACQAAHRSHANRLPASDRVPIVQVHVGLHSAKLCMTTTAALRLKSCPSAARQGMLVPCGHLQLWLCVLEQMRRVLRRPAFSGCTLARWRLSRVSLGPGKVPRCALELLLCTCCEWRTAILDMSCSWRLRHAGVL